MITLPPEISDAERAVHSYKHELLVRVMACIARKALVQAHVSAADVPEDIVAKEHRQGVASNAWNALRAMEIIEALPMGHTDPERGIFGGRIQNKNGDAKGRWVTCYRLRSRSAAFTWAAANNVRLTPQVPIQPPTFQLELTT
jgi:hypothetical protein